MDENILDTTSIIEEPATISEEVNGDAAVPGEDNVSTSYSVSSGDVSSSSSDTTIIYNMEYDESLGGYPVVIVNDISEDYGVSTYALANDTSGYQVTDYWLNYFRGVLQKYPESDYVAFSTRVYTGSTSGYNNYVNHYYLYVGDVKNGGSVTCYDCYSESSIYYVEITQETVSAFNLDDYSTLIYSNLGNVSDLRNGGGYVGTTTILFFLAFFAVYVVCRDFFKSCVRKRR